MRELTVKIRFVTPCLGNIKTTHKVENAETGAKKKRTVFKFPRNHEGKVILMQAWWASVMRSAADVMCRHQKFVEGIRFSLEVDGIPERVFKRYYENSRYSSHEAFLANDVIGISCLVPPTINNDDFWRLMSLAGEYYGMSPFRPGEFGFFKVDSIKLRGPEPEEPDEEEFQEQPDGKGKMTTAST